MIDPKLLTLLKVNDLGSYTEAAKELNLTQPAVSLHLKCLEKETNIKIFNRTSNGIKQTKDGEILIKYAKRIVSLYKELDLKLKDNEANHRSYIIGITHTSETNLIAEVLATYASLHPEVKIKIKTGAIKKLYEELSSYAIDLAFIDGKPNKKYSSILLDTDSLVAVFNKNNPLAKKGLVQIEDLKNEKKILRSSKSKKRNLFQSTLNSDGFSLDDFNIIMELDNIATIKDLISENPCLVSVLLRSACYGHAKDLAIIPIENLNMSREVNIVFPKDFSDRSFLREVTSLYHNKLGR